MPYLRKVLKIRTRFSVSLISAVSMVFFSFGPSNFINLAQAAAATSAMEYPGNFGALRLKQGSDFKAILKITFGSNENGKTLNAVNIGFAGTAGSPTWTNGAATSSELKDLATTNGGISLWKDNGDSNFSFASDAQETLASTPVYGPSNTFSITPATPPAIVTDDVYYIVLKSDTSGVTNNNAFTVTLPADGIVTSSSSPTITLTVSQPVTMDTAAPTISGSNPASASTGVPISSVPMVNFNENINPETINPSNVSFTAGGPVGAQFRPSMTSFEVLVSSPPTLAVGSRFAKLAAAGQGFFMMMGTNPITPQGSYLTPVVGDIVSFQRETFPPEIGVISDSTLTSGTFGVNGFPLFGGQNISFVATPSSTGLVSAGTTLNAGDIVVVNTTANPTDVRYNWHIVTVGAAVNNAALRIDGSASAPTFAVGSRFSVMPTSGTATDNGATAGGVLAVSQGNLVFAKIGSSYGWHLVTTAGNLSSDGTEGTAGLDGANAAASLVASGSQMTKLTATAQGDLADVGVSIAQGDLLFANATANAAFAGSYNWHMATNAGSNIGASTLRLDGAAGNLAISTAYTLTVGTGVTDKAGNPLAAPTVITFTTGSTGGTNTTPPFVQTTIPQGGTQNFPPNGIVKLTFSVDMATSAGGSVTNSANVGLFVDNFGVPGSAVTAVNTYDSSTRTVTIDPSANLSLNTGYIAKVATAVKSSTDVAMPQEYRLYFRTSGEIDSTAPTVLGVFPANAATGVNRSAVVSIGFSKDIDQSTVTASTVTLVKTSDLTAVTGNVSYNPANRSVVFSPTSQLQGSTGYTLRVLSGASGVKDTMNNALASDYTSTFTTNNDTDSASPAVSFSNADNFGITVTFSESMRSGGGPDAADYVSNYTLENPVGSNVALGGKTINYDPGTRTARISGLALQNGSAYKVTVGVSTRDLAGNAIDTTGTPPRNTSYGTVANAEATGGQLGPGSGTINPSMQGMNPTRVSPLTRAAGATSNYKAEFLAATTIPNGGQIVLTFPSGFNVASAAAVAATESFCNADMNGGGSVNGVPTINSVTADSGAGTVTIATAGAASGANAFVCMELSGIVNSTLPNSTGYTVDIKTRDTSGNNRAILENKISAPFFLGQTGSRTLTVNVFNDNGAGGGTADNNVKDGTEPGIESARVFMFSPAMGGQNSQTNASGVATFTNLSDGDYMIGVDPESVIGGGFITNSIPSSTSIGADTTANFGLRTSSLNITGTITGPISSSVDIFAGSQNGFVKRTITLTGGADAYSLPVRANTTYNVGVGPAMPEGSFEPGAPPPPPPTFTFMPPPNQQVNVVASTVSGVNFTLSSADKTITGTVVDSSATGVSNAGVFCRPTVNSTSGASNGFGTGAMTNSSGAFTVRVNAGVYLCGAFKPGMPPVADKQITVPAAGDNSPTSLTFTLDAASSLTISGTLKDDSGNSIPYGGVSGRKVVSTGNTTPIGGDSSNFVGGPSDANGTYTLYVSAGTWVVEAFAPGFGRLGTKTITVSASNMTGQDFSAQTMNLGTITGTVTQAGATVQGAMVRAENSSGGSGNMSQTASDGTYSLKVPAGTYTVYAFLPGVGEAAPLTNVVVTDNTTSSGNNFTLSAPIILTVVVSDGTNPVTGAGIDARSSDGRGNFTNVSSTSGANATYTLNVPPGVYTVRVNHPSYGPITSCPSASSLASVNSTRTITCTVSGQTYAVTGTVSDGSPVGGAWASLSGEPTGSLVSIFIGSQTASNGTFTINVPAGNYRLRVDKANYLSPAATDVTVTSVPVAVGTITLSTSDYSISGQVTLSASGVSGAFVDANDGNGGYAVAQTDSSGNYSLGVTDGTWTVTAHSMGYESSPLTVEVDGDDMTDEDIALSAISGFTLKAERPENVTPTAGGYITNPDIGSNFKMNIPANALGTSSNSATITTKINTALPNPPSGSILAKNAITISAVDSSGTPVKNLNDSVTIVIPYTESDLPAGASESALVIGVYNSATQTYDTLPTTVDTDNNTLTATTTHFSDFAPLVAAEGAPVTPTGLIANAGSGTVALSWNAASGADTYNIYRSTDNVTFPFLAATASTAYSSSGLTNNVTYYYKVSSVGGGAEESAATAAVSATPRTSSSGGGGGASPQSVSTLSLTAPNGGQTLKAGENTNITWTTSGSGINKVSILLSSDSGLNFPTTIATVDNVGSYVWKVPNQSGSSFRIKLAGQNSSGAEILSSISAGNFSISAAGSIAPADQPLLVFKEVPGVTSGKTFNPTSAKDGSPNINTDKSLPTATGANCTADSLIKSTAFSTVYYCGADGKRYVFPNYKTYVSWFADFSGVVTLSDVALAGIPLGGMVTYRPGVVMVKIQTDPKVYAVATGGLLRWVTSEAIAKKLYGLDWNKKIDDIDVSFFVKYRFGENITE